MSAAEILLTDNHDEATLTPELMEVGPMADSVLEILHQPGPDGAYFRIPIDTAQRMRFTDYYHREIISKIELVGNNSHEYDIFMAALLLKHAADIVELSESEAWEIVAEEFDYDNASENEKLRIHGVYVGAAIRFVSAQRFAVGMCEFNA
jgi:hypothetical protein